MGKFKRPKNITNRMLKEARDVITEFPSKIKKLTKKLREEQFEQVYRPGGWNIRQLVHHCADSHMNAYIRCKLALTEENPVIKPYQEDTWAKLSDYSSNKLTNSILILEGLHTRWIELLAGLNEDELKRTYYHPEEGRNFEIQEVILHYSWHCRHHLEHIRLATKGEKQDAELETHENSDDVKK